MNFDDAVLKLRNGIGMLPGEEAHHLLAPVQRLSTKEYLKQNPSYKTSCVAVILYPDNNSTRLLLMERPESTHAHGGQISFPGGKREQDDVTLLDTAMREMYEEVGVAPSAVTMIGALSEIYIPVSNFLVHPFVGFSETKPVFQLNPGEVKNVVTPEIQYFFIKDLPSHRFESRSFGWIDAPYFPYENHMIWGATAMIISELIYILKR
ncbi:MAG: CoA pyrophosphatase [Bacteroidota bacterium]